MAQPYQCVQYFCVSKQQHGPTLPVCAVFLCVQTTAWPNPTSVCSIFVCPNNSMAQPYQCVQYFCVSKQQHGPTLPVCAVFLCVQTTAWLPAFENFVPLLMNIALTNEYIQFSLQHPCSLSSTLHQQAPPPPPHLFNGNKSPIFSLYTSPTSLHCTQVPHLFTVHKSHISSLYTSRPSNKHGHGTQTPYLLKYVNPQLPPGMDRAGLT